MIRIVKCTFFVIFVIIIMLVSLVTLAIDFDTYIKWGCKKNFDAKEIRKEFNKFVFEKW